MPPRGVPMDEYVDAQPFVRQARLMVRFFDEVNERTEIRDEFSTLYAIYMDVLNAELAPYAAMLALAIVELEDAYPEIERPTPDAAYRFSFHGRKADVRE